MFASAGAAHYKFEYAMRASTTARTAARSGSRIAPHRFAVKVVRAAGLLNEGARYILPLEFLRIVDPGTSGATPSLPFTARLYGLLHGWGLRRTFARTSSVAPTHRAIPRALGVRGDTGLPRCWRISLSMIRVGNYVAKCRSPAITGSAGSPTPCPMDAPPRGIAGVYPLSIEALARTANGPPTISVVNPHPRTGAIAAAASGTRGRRSTGFAARDLPRRYRGPAAERLAAFRQSLARPVSFPNAHARNRRNAGLRSRALRRELAACVNRDPRLRDRRCECVDQRPSFHGAHPARSSQWIR